MFSSANLLLLGIAGYLSVAVSVIALLVGVIALGDCLGRHAPAFDAVGKLTKNQWAAILGASLLATLVFGGWRSLLTLINNVVPYGASGGLSFFGMIGFVASLVYLLDVRPRVKAALDNRNRW